MPGLEQQLVSLIAKHGERGILVDTNVLLLYLFGKLLPAALGQKRLAKYSLEDADLIVQFVGRFGHILATQHVLAETSNLARQIVSGGMRDLLVRQLYPWFCLQTPGSFKHCDVPGASIDAGLFARLGLTDAGLASLVRSDHLLLTDDLDLYIAAVSSGGDAINFTHMREAAGTV
ncbi:hypothetical protein [Duganella sp. FT27W]|uniref:hypothetical protein n=1 Tax=Duganella sp. FT27W TaxID=2654636 RepID=UPI00128E134B|nr:hypothetical protein [Duganella sp. FT27W]MPQ60030.1 hypothetical protein [Duganella sp. FT27W]